MNINEEAKKELFKRNKSFVVNEKNLGRFFTRLKVIGEKLDKKKETKDESLERSIRGSGIKAEDLDRMAQNVVLDLARHLDHVEFIQLLVDGYKAGKMKHKPMYTKQEQVDKYKVELGKLFHSLSVKLRFAQMFGFGEIESIITVVDTKKLPSIEQAKKMHKSQMRKMFKKAEDNRGRVDVKSIKTLKKELKTKK